MIEKLQKIGLSEKESYIYLELAKSDESTANSLAKKTSINRTVTYNILHQLVEKGIVNYIKKNGKRFFSIVDPKSLLTSIKEKEAIANALISEINKIKKAKESERNVEVYEGKEGLNFIFNEIRKAKDLRIINATGLLHNFLKFSAGHITKDIELNANAKIIACQSMKKTYLAKYKFKIKYLPEKAENYATTFIFENKIIIQSLKNKPFLIKIENEEIYDGYKKNFDVLWSKLK